MRYPQTPDEEICRLDPSGRVRPRFVRGDAARERWDLCVRLAADVWSKFDDGPPSSTWMYYTPRSYYFSDIPTGSPDDAHVVMRDTAEAC